MTEKVLNMFNYGLLATAICFTSGIFFGAWLRCRLGKKITWLSSRFGWLNFVLTMLGCGALGFVCFSIFTERWFFCNGWYLFFCLGVLGGYLLWGAISYGPLTMVSEGRPVAAGLLAGGYVIAGMLAAMGGAALGKIF